MIKLAIFDLGNVLYLNHLDRAFDHWAQASGRTAESFHAFLSSDDVHADFERGTLTSQQFHEAFCHICAVEMPFMTFAEGWNAIYGDYMPGTVEAIKQLKKHIPVIALTNTNELHCPTWQGRYREALSLFDAIYISNELGMRKPDAEIFEHVLQVRGVQPDEVIFFDDIPANVRTARALGIKTYEVTGPNTIPQAMVELASI